MTYIIPSASFIVVLFCVRQAGRVDMGGVGGGVGGSKDGGESGGDGN
jgi:hypothetical protein